MSLCSRTGLTSLKYHIRALWWVSIWTKSGPSDWRVCFTLWIYVARSSFRWLSSPDHDVCLFSEQVSNENYREAQNAFTSLSVDWRTVHVCMWVCVSGNVWSQIQRAVAGASRRRSRARAHCPVNTAGSDWRAMDTVRLLRWKSASSHTVRLYFNRKKYIHKNKQLFTPYL